MSSNVTAPSSKAPDVIRLALTLSVALALIASLARTVIRTEGNLAWDDADYLRRGLRIARVASAQGGLDVAKAIGQTLKERPKPPMLVAWIEAVSLAVGRDKIVAIIVASSVVPYALLMAGVATIARRFFGTGAVLPAVLCLAASPISTSYGAKVMVETFLSLWILLVYASAALVLERPTRFRAVLLGTALGLAMMTKLTVALLLPAAAVLFVVLYWRRHATDREALKTLTCIMLPLGVIAGPWYVRNGRSAVEFAVFSSKYNIVAEGNGSVVPVVERLSAMVGEVAGWPLAVGLVVAAALMMRRNAEPAARADSAGRDFVRLTAIGIVSAALALLIPAYFQPRFLLPAWPALSVCLGGWLGSAAAAGRQKRLGFVYALVGACAAHSVAQVGHEGRCTTYWQTKRLIDNLVTNYHTTTIGNVGNCGDWNVCKTGLINELRAAPGDCFVLHDLSKNEPAELKRRLAKFDALVVLDRGGLPPELFTKAPGLNRGYDSIDEALGAGTTFRRVPVDLAGLPPLSVYVRRR